MQIGRKIYYDLANGNVILARESRNGGVVDTTTEEDFITYAALAERVPSTVGSIQLEYGQFDAEFLASTSRSVNISTLEIVFDYTQSTPPPTVSLEARIKALEDIQLANMLV